MFDEFTDVSIGVTVNDGAYWVKVAFIRDDGSGHAMVMDKTLSIEFGLALIEAAAQVEELSTQLN